MKLPTILLATLTCTAAAHPFVVVSTRIHQLVPTHLHHRRQGLLDTLQSAVEDAFGVEDDEPTTTVGPAVTRVTLPAPVTAPATSEEEEPRTTVSPSREDDDEDESDKPHDSTSDEESTSTTRSRATTRASSTTSTTTSESTSATPAPTPALGTAAPTASASASNSDDDKEGGSGVPSGGVAVAVIMVLLILAISAFLVFKYNPRCQAWWAARQEKARFERSYREAIDGSGGLSSSPTLRQQALAGGATSRRRTMLQSFFAPATARLNETTEIRRKPVNWGEPGTSKLPDTPTSSSFRDLDSEKIPMTASAAPLGQIERYSIFPPQDPIPSPLPTPPSKARMSTASRAESVTALPTVVSPPRAPQVPQLPQSYPQSQPQPQPQPRALTHDTYNHQATVSPPVPTQTSTYIPTSAPQIPITSPVSPMSLMPRDPITPGGTKRSSFDRLPPISPMSTYQQPMDSIANRTSMPGVAGGFGGRREEPPLPALPPLPPQIPALVIAKRGSDGVFRLN